jgi:ubiquinone/menaquinone biosynthesis C-methylase UbiE
MDHFTHIYSSQAVAYQRMIAAEDADQHILAAIQKIVQPQGKTLLDLGTGTGRIPGLLGAQALQTIGLDLHHGMLLENQRVRDQSRGAWDLAQADMRNIPLPAQIADLITAGWAMGHFCGWYPHTWRSEMTAVLEEMHRLVRPGGWMIILETLSTGSLVPQPPNTALATYYAWLEDNWGFQRVEISTDYQFRSVDEAVQSTEFFFGSDLAQQIQLKQWARLPEWTGLWYKQMHSFAQTATIP